MASYNTGATVKTKSENKISQEEDILCGIITCRQWLRYFYMEQIWKNKVQNAKIKKVDRKIGGKLNGYKRNDGCEF